MQQQQQQHGAAPSSAAAAPARGAARITQVVACHHPLIASTLLQRGRPGLRTRLPILLVLRSSC
jgi:hypothetical protein